MKTRRIIIATTAIASKRGWLWGVLFILLFAVALPAVPNVRLRTPLFRQAKA